jgi:hypothetical protein
VSRVRSRRLLGKHGLNKLRKLPFWVLLCHHRSERAIDVHELHCRTLLDGHRDELVSRLRGLPDGQL